MAISAIKLQRNSDAEKYLAKRMRLYNFRYYLGEINPAWVTIDLNQLLTAEYDYVECLIGNGKYELAKYTMENIGLLKGINESKRWLLINLS